MIELYMTEQEHVALRDNHPRLYHALKDRLGIFVPAPHTQLQEDLNERLGDLASEYGYRMEEGPDLSRVRGVSQRPIALYVDEAHNLSAIYDSGEPSIVAQKWMEHRRICTRNLLACLSGDAH